MTHIVHGQHDGQIERIRETQDWLGATPMTSDGRLMETDTAPDYQVLMAQVQLIRDGLASGIGRIIVSEPDAYIRNALKQMLTDEELLHVVFDPDDPGVVRSDPETSAASRVHSRQRDIIR